MADTGPTSTENSVKPVAYASAYIAIAALLILLLFNIFPEIDLDLSRIFFHASACQKPVDNLTVCGGFPIGSITILKWLRELLQIAPFAAAAGLGLLLLTRQARRKWRPDLWSAEALGAFLAYVVSVGLMVNVVFKEHWGRPRPVQVLDFGGSNPFVPAGEMARYCTSNCSFVSGESASAFWLILLVPLLPLAWQKRGLLIAFGVYVLTSGLRIAFGGHFLSDVVMAAVLTLLIYSIVMTMVAIGFKTRVRGPFWLAKIFVPFMPAAVHKAPAQPNQSVNPPQRRYGPRYTSKKN
jgi:lipid A 4'-phosphatase